MATAPSSISFIQPTDPGSYADAIRLQRQQQIADALLQQSQAPLSADLPQNLRVVPRLGWQGGLIKLGQALMANKLENNVTGQRAAMAQQQMAALAQQFGGGSGQGGAQPAPPQSPYAGAQSAMAGPEQGQPGPTMAAAAQIPQQAAPQAPAGPPQGGPMLIPGMDPQAAMRFYMADPGKYMEMLAASRSPTNEQKNWLAQGVDPHQLAGGTVLAGQRAGMTDTEKFNDAIGRTAPGSPERAALVAAQNKANYIAPIDAKPGTPVLDPVTLQPKFFAPKTADGVGLNFQDPMHPTAYALPGYADSNAAIVAADQRAKTDNSVFQVTGPEGQAGTVRGSAVPGGGGGSAAMTPPAAQPSATMAVPRGAAPGAPGQRQPAGLWGPGATDSAIQKTSAESIGGAPAQLAASKQAITGLESALRTLQGVSATGQGTAKTNEVVSALNNALPASMQIKVDNNQQYQELAKLLSNSLNAAANGSSAGGSDARFESFMHGQPNSETMSKPALDAAIRYVLSQHDAAAARADFLPKAYNTAKAAGDPNAALTAQQQWAQVYDPQVFAFSRMSPADQVKFKASMTPEQQQQFGRHYNGLYNMGWVK